MSHPDALSELFLGRSLGRIQVPRFLRAAGLRLTTLAERYGVLADESVSDVTWVSDAGDRREAVLMKDARVRYNPAEKQALPDSRVRALCPPSMAPAIMVQLQLDHLGGITYACQEHELGMFVATRGGARRMVA